MVRATATKFRYDLPAKMPGRPLRPSGKNFRDNVKLLMSQVKPKPITESDLARALEVTPTTINRWLSGSREPSFDDFDKIARELGKFLGRSVIVQELFLDPTEKASVGIDAYMALEVLRAAIDDKHQGN